MVAMEGKGDFSKHNWVPEGKMGEYIKGYRRKISSDQVLYKLDPGACNTDSSLVNLFGL